MIEAANTHARARARTHTYGKLLGLGALPAIAQLNIAEEEGARRGGGRGHAARRA